ncbi:polysaccharide biosynthesis C-terminal domain-containing protein [Microbacterium lacticum]|uniref:oligosaccharide flippase family protein n=1 Tax=Microbacterium lacticum TaxID=33885 RepID=UPI003A8B77EF
MTTAADERGDIARGGALSLIGASLSAVLGLVLTVVLARSLGDYGSGVVLQAMSVFAIVLSIAKFGLDSTSVWLLPRVLIDDPRDVPAALSTILLLTVATSSVVTLVVQALVPHIWPETSAVGQAVRMAVWFIPAGALVLVMGSAVRALGTVRDYVLLGNIALPALRLPAVTIAAAAASSLTTVSLAWAAPNVLVALLLAVTLMRLQQRPGYARPTRASMRRYGRPIARFASPRTVSAGLEQSLLWLDVLIVGLVAGPAAAGLYGGASRFVQAGLVIDSALRVVVSPRLSSLIHQRDISSTQNLYSIASVWLVLFASPLYIVLAVFSPLILSILGSSFVAGSWALTILCVGATVTFLAGNIHSVLLMSGRSGLASINKAIVLVLNVAGNVLLIPLWGINGAAFAWAVAMVADATLAGVQVWRVVGVRFRIAEVLRALLVGVSTLGVASALAALFLGQSWFAFAVALLAGGAAYVCLCIRLRRRLYLDGLRGVILRRG